ncbi:MAG: tetratricopeptide (TPR) repeat protein [Kiritimatiellia bacterium]|jgi:tetratricopeptide (TPR) repeat protein
MNMLRTDFGELQLDAELIDASEVIEGYIYLSEELVDNKLEEKRQAHRVNSLFVLLLCSVAVYLWSNDYFTQTQLNLESFHSAPSFGQVAPVLSDVLSDGLVEQLQPETAASVSDSQLELDLGVPEDIVNFIDADIAAEKQVIATTGIVLEEVNPIADRKVNINKLLVSGNALFKRDRLMSPSEHNAFARYEKVLSVHPGHPKALQGIKKIVDRYVYLAESVIAKNQEYKVPGLIKKAYQVGEKYMDVTVLMQQFSAYLPNDSIFFDASSANNNTPVNSEKSPTSNAETRIEGKNLNAHDEVIFIADRKIAETAYKLFLSGDLASAEQVLKNFTQLSGIWGESNDLLLKMYLSQEKIAQAENLIYESKALDTYQFAEKAARVMMTRGDSQGALKMLVAYRPEFLENTSYYVLLASLYHKVGDFQRSVYWYRQLLSVNHKDARLWLGLAVSLDALNNVEDALQAFGYVRLYAQNQSAIKQYINERQLALVN